MDADGNVYSRHQGQNQMQGTITYFHKERGFGFVAVTTAGRHQSYFLHVSDIVEGSLSPVIGDAAEFDVEPSKSGKRCAMAVNCKIASSTAASGLEILAEPGDRQ